MSWHKVLHAGNVLDDGFKAIKTTRTGIALIPFHDGSPLSAGHGTGAGIGQPINQHIFSMKLENVEFGLLQQLDALDTAGHADRFDTLDAKRFNQRLGHGDLKVLFRCLRR
jgi:hypothetical protein